MVLKISIHFLKISSNEIENYLNVAYIRFVMDFGCENVCFSKQLNCKSRLIVVIANKTSWGLLTRIIRASLSSGSAERVFKIICWTRSLFFVQRFSAVCKRKTKVDGFWFGNCFIRSMSANRLRTSGFSPKWVSSNFLISFNELGFLAYTNSAALPLSLVLICRVKNVFWSPPAILNVDGKIASPSNSGILYLCFEGRKIGFSKWREFGWTIEQFVQILRVEMCFRKKKVKTKKCWKRKNVFKNS